MEAEKSRIKEALEKVRKGVTNQNWENAEVHIADDWISFQNGAKVSWDEQKGMFSENISQHESNFDVQSVELANDNSLAVCIAKESTDYQFGDEDVHEDAWFTTTWRKDAGTWKMFHLNRSVNPAQIPEKQKKMMEEQL